MYTNLKKKYFLTDHAPIVLPFQLAPDITARTDEEVKWKKHNYCNNVMKVLTKSEDGDSHQDFDTVCLFHIISFFFSSFVILKIW